MQEKEEIMARNKPPRRARQAGPKRLFRSGRDRVLGGVCGGLGEYFEVDPVLVRVAWVLFSVLYGAGLLAYIVAWIIVPRNPNHNWSD